MADASRAHFDLVLVAHDDDLVDDSLSNWEIIDPSDEDDDLDFCFDDESGDLELDEESGSILSLLSSQPFPDHPVISHVDARLDVVKDESCIDEYNEEEEEEEEEEEDDDDDDDDDGFDLDDELVPKSVSDRFGRGRLRKLGKRAYPKMNKSKRLAYHYNRPGCVYGKHGLGLKHNLI